MKIDKSELPCSDLGQSIKEAMQAVNNTTPDAMQHSLEYQQQLIIDQQHQQIQAQQHQLQEQHQQLLQLQQQIQDLQTQVQNSQRSSWPPLQHSAPAPIEQSERKRQKTGSVSRYAIPTANRFETLNNDTDEDEHISSAETVIKIPPIIIHKAENFQLLINDIKNVVKEDFTTKIEADRVKVKLNSIEDFRVLRKFCNENNIEYHTFRDPSIKTFSIIIKDIHTLYSEIEIFQELVKKYPVIKVTRLHGKDRKPLTTCAVDLEDNNKGRSILALDRFLYSVIRVFPRSNQKLPIQCKNCQRFDHTQANCGRAPRCVRCLGNHHYSKCTEPKTETSPRCVNCKKEHTANWKGCEVYQKLLKNQTERYNQRRQAFNNRESHESKNLDRKPVPQNHPQQTTPTQRPPINPWFSNPQRLNSQAPPLSNSNLPLHQGEVITTIINQVINALIPQIQILIQSALDNGRK